ncbi:transcription initiation factor IIA subunit 1 isoform X2 [Cherax quadricarinatus]
MANIKFTKVHKTKKMKILASPAVKETCEKKQRAEEQRSRRKHGRSQSRPPHTQHTVKSVSQLKMVEQPNLKIEEAHGTTVEYRSHDDDEDKYIEEDESEEDVDGPEEDVDGPEEDVDGPEEDVGCPEEEQLNSNDDLTDDETDSFNTDNVVVCQYVKITRVRNTFKLSLKDGLMTRKGKEYFFRKATGEGEW